MKLHAMMDFETLGLGENAVVVQMAACMFDIHDGRILSSITANINAEKSMANGFEVDGSTLLWWLSQPVEAQNAAFSGPWVPSEEATQRLADFLSPADYVWTNGHADAMWMTRHQNRFRTFNPVPYWKFVNMKTVWALGYTKADVPNTGTPHNALDDCRYQVAQLVASLAGVKYDL